MSERGESGHQFAAPDQNARATTDPDAAPEPTPENTPDPAVTAYTAGKVPGVWYQEGVAHSPPAEPPLKRRGPRPFVDKLADPGMPPRAAHPDALAPGEVPPTPLPLPARHSVTPPGAGAPPHASASRSAAAPGTSSARNDTPPQPMQVPSELRRGDGRPPTRPPNARTPARPKKRRFRIRPLRIILALPVIFLVGLAIIAFVAWGRIDKVDAIPADPGGAVSASQVYMLVGSDSRADLSDEERDELGTGSPTSQLADTIMLLYIPNDGSPALVSIPRDSLVDIPGRGQSRINAAYSFGGPLLLVDTVQRNTGVAIDDYVQIGLGGFAGIVDALGGVELCLDQAISDDKAHIDLPEGCQTLDGPDALGYARARQFDPRSDLGRVERQREIVGAIADQSLSLGTFVNPFKLTSLGLAGGDALTIGENTGPLALGNFVLTMGRLVGDGNTLTVPLGRVGNTVDWHPQDAPRLWAAMQAGEPIPADLLNAG